MINNKRKKVSIVVPVYNTYKFLEKCFDSLLSQTIDNYEIVVINDGSKDDSASLCKNYANKYPDIIKYIEIENSGVANARNLGIENSTGEYIGFVDSDDYIKPDMFDLLYNKAKEQDSDIVVCGYCYENEKTGVIDNRGLGGMSNFGLPLKENPDLLLKVDPIVASKLFKRDFLNENELYFHKYRIFEDLLLVYSALLKANRIDKVNEALYYYVRHENESVTGQLNDKFYDLYAVMNELKDYYKKNSDYNYDDYLTYRCLHHAYLRFSYKAGIKKLLLKYKFIKDSYNFFDEFDPNWRGNMYFKLRRRENAIFRTKLFWLFVPIARKIKEILLPTTKTTNDD